MKSLFLSLLFLAIIPHLQGTEWPIHEISLHQKKEIINGVTFIARYETADGISTQSLTINGKLVDEREYEEALLNAEKELRRIQRAQEREQLMREMELKNERAVAAHKKMLRLVLAQTEQELSLLNQQALKPYLFFEPSTCATEQDLAAIAQHLVPAAHILLQNTHITHSVDEYTHLLAQLEPLPQKLRTMLHATKHNAITLCNDTKMLKELLEFVA